MSDIVLATLNARWIHTAFGLRYLRANLGALRARSSLVEGDIQMRPLDFVEKLLAHDPRVVGLGVYVWNASATLAVVRLLTQVAPEVVVVLGGPEISHETERQELAHLADHVVRGEGDLAFRELCERILAGEASIPHTIDAPPPDLAHLILPYAEYDATDIAHRVAYVEASRGCPFECEFCLSALDERVRTFPLDSFLAAMGTLLERGVRHFKFVDRTFNLGVATSLRILRFFRERWQDGMLLHFEMIPDRLPEALRDEITWFPTAGLQFEVGIQTFDPEVAQRISRRQDPAKIAANLDFLREHTGVHVHADLIVGLPGEDLPGFGRGFDQLLALGPQEIQVGILKRLHGAPIARHDLEWDMRYSTDPPYEILRNKSLSFGDLQRMRRFARFFDLLCNSGSFACSAPLLWNDGSPFARFLVFSDWLFAKTKAMHGIALHRLARLLFDYLVDELRVPHKAVGHAMRADFARTRPNDWPSFLSPYPAPPAAPTSPAINPAASRQARHARG